MKSRVIVIAVTMLGSLGMLAGGCVVPTGINDGSPGALTDMSNVPEDGIYFTGINVVLSTSPGIGNYETPIQFRNIMLAAISIYSTGAAYHPTALELFGRADESEARRRCADTEAGLLGQHRRVTLAYATFWGMGTFIPETKPALTAILADYGLDYERCTEGDLEGCDDVTTPWGLAKLMVDECVQFGSRDGWNADGSLGGREFNKMPYSDWRSSPYKPVNDPWKLVFKKRWQPLLERDARGFFYHQEHVVPHIGQTARSIFLGDKDICKRRLSNPKYDLRKETKMAMKRSGELTDELKAEVEFFDSKLTSIVPLQAQWFVRQGKSLDSFQFIQADVASIGAMYESVIVSWKEKVRHDRVRPTSFVQGEFPKNSFFSYAGPNVPAQAIDGAEWEPYIRVMPHAEYPSGSSCICAAFQTTMSGLLGGDDVTEALGGPLVGERFAGSSTVEEDKPGADVAWVYNSWSDITARCGQSRLNGGMHFTASVPAGEELCLTIGTKVADTFKKLEAGAAPDFIVDFDASSMNEKRCKKNT